MHDLVVHILARPVLAPDYLCWRGQGAHTPRPVRLTGMVYPGRVYPTYHYTIYTIPYHTIPYHSQAIVIDPLSSLLQVSPDTTSHQVVPSET